MAFPGLASSSLLCGTTCHSRFRIDIKTGEVVLPLGGYSPVVAQLRKARVWIVHEVLSFRVDVLENMFRYVHSL